MQLTKWNSCLNSNYFREKPAADAGPNVQTSLIRFCSGYVVQVVVEQIHSISMSQDVDLLLAPQQITNKSKQWSFGFNLLWTCRPTTIHNKSTKKSTINPQQVRNTQQVLQHVVQQSTTKSNKWSLEISQQVRRIMEDEDLKVDSNDTLIIIIIVVVVVILFLNN